MIYHKDERSQRQHSKLLRKLDQKHKEMSKFLRPSATICPLLHLEVTQVVCLSRLDSTPAHSPSPRKTELNGIKRTARNGASSVGTSEDGEESSSVPDEDDDVASIVEQLSNVQLPLVSEITSRGKCYQNCLLEPY